MKTLKMVYEETDDEGRSILRVTRIIGDDNLNLRDKAVAAILTAAYRDIRNCAVKTKALEEPLDKMAQVLGKSS